MSDRLCIDLCSGLGGFSQAFVDAGWDVLRIDNDDRFRGVPFTIIADVCQVDSIVEAIGAKGMPSLIVASPPCERFSLGNRMFPKVGVAKALEVVGAVFEIIARVRPENWIVENPRGRLRWFIGNPTSSIRLSDYGSKYMKPTDLWHNIGFAPLVSTRPYEPSWSSTKNQGKGSTGLLRLRDPAKRAEMPKGLGQAILDAISPAVAVAKPVVEGS